MTPTDQDLERARQAFASHDQVKAIAALLAEERAAVLGRLTEGDVVEAAAAEIAREEADPSTHLVDRDLARRVLAAVAALLGEP